MTASRTAQAKANHVARALIIAAILLFFAAFGQAQTVAPLGGLGSVQFLDNSGVPLTAGVLYSYQAGTSTQQATFSDSTGVTQNPNPVPFGSGARATVWLSIGQFYKFVLCLQNDGAFCAPADVLFSVDNVPGGSTSGSGGSSPFTGVFISSSGSPATSGILRLASSDQICWRNASGSTNLCISKDSNDLLSWAGGSLKFPENPCPAGITGFDIICSDNSAHRWKMANNGGGALQIVAAGVDINTSDQVTQLHAGGTPLPICGTPPSTSQYLQWSGSCLGGASAEQALGETSSFNGSSGICAVGGLGACSFVTFANAHTLLRLITNTSIAPVGCSVNAVVGVRDYTSSTTLLSQTPTTTGLVTTTGTVTIPAGDSIGIGLITQATGCSTYATFSSTVAVYQ